MLMPKLTFVKKEFDIPTITLRITALTYSKQKHMEELVKVLIKSFDVGMEVKTRGIEFEVRTSDGKSQLGDLYLTKSGVEWCEGKVQKGNGTKLNWGKFIEKMNELPKPKPRARRK